MASVINGKKLAIICPLLNCLDYTRQMLRSIPPVADYGLVFINNGSTDGTEAYLKVFSKSPDAIVKNYTENKGVAHAWNTGINLAIKKWDSEAYLIINNDILFHRVTIKKMLEALEEKDVLLVSANNVKDKLNSPEALEQYIPPLTQDFRECPDFSCFMMKKEALVSVGYFDEKFYPAYYEDNDYHYRINRAGKRALNINTASYYHFGSQTIKNGEEVKRLTNANYMKNKEYYVSKWGGPPGQEIYTRPFNK